jgi:hypothetical protein
MFEAVDDVDTEMKTPRGALARSYTSKRLPLHPVDLGIHALDIGLPIGFLSKLHIVLSQRERHP